MSLRASSRLAHRLLRRQGQSAGAAAVRPFSAAAAAAEAPAGASDVAASHIALEDKHGAHNYHPLPVVLARGRGARSRPVGRCGPVADVPCRARP